MKRKTYIFGALLTLLVLTACQGGKTTAGTLLHRYILIPKGEEGDKTVAMLAYSLHNGSFSQPCGNPMACKSILGYSANNLNRELFKSMQGVIVCSKYNKVHSWWYNLMGFWLGVIHWRGSRLGNWGFKAKRLFHIRAWWAQQLRSTVIHLIQLSKYVYWGSPSSLATCFFSRLSLNRQNNLESVPKETTSKVFHTGGRAG